MTTEPQYVLLNLYTFVLFIQLDTIKCILKIVEGKIQRLLPTLPLILFTETSYFIVDGTIVKNITNCVFQDMIQNTHLQKKAVFIRITIIKGAYQKYE